MQQTFLLIKPDGVQRGLIGEIVNRFERKGFKLVGAKLVHASKDLGEAHYIEHKEKPFFGELVDFITSGPAFAMIWEGDDVIAVARRLMGATNPKEAAPGTIRGDYASSIGMNIVHGSDSPESASRELKLWFDERAAISYTRSIDEWI